MSQNEITAHVQGKFDIDAFWMFLSLIVGSIMMVVTVVGVQAYVYYTDWREEQVKVVEKVDAELSAYLNAQDKALNSYGIRERTVAEDPSAVANPVVMTIPVDRAIELYVERQTAK